jgi:hypothetical protein
VVVVIAGEGLPQLAARMLGVSESGYYEWRNGAPPQRAIRRAWLRDLIHQIERVSRSAAVCRHPARSAGVPAGVRTLHQKVSAGYMRTLTGAEQLTASRSYLATATEYGVCHLPAIGELAESRARMPAQP